MDKILIRGLRIFAFHGVNPEEKEDGQLFIIDLTAALDLREPCETDRLETTVSYAKIIKNHSPCDAVRQERSAGIYRTAGDQCYFCRISAGSAG